MFLVVAARAVAAAPTLTDNDAGRLLNLEPRPHAWAWPRQPSEFDPFKRDPPPGSANYIGDGMKDQSVVGLGDEAWRVTQQGTMVTYGWRRANAVIEVHLQCIRACMSDPAAAARAWAASIDRAAVASL
jgi:hypothetical protein